VQVILASMANAKTVSISSSVTAHLVMAENVANQKLTNVDRTPASMVVTAMTCSMLILALACQVTQAKTVRQTSTTVQTISAKMEAHVLIWLTTTNVFVKFHSPDKIVTLKWILVLLIVAVTVPVALQVRTIETSIVHVHLDLLDGSVTKTSTSVSFHHHLAEMVQLVRTQMGHINACAQKATKAKTAPSTLTIALHSHVKTVEHVSMASAITLACVTKALKENIAKRISTNVFPSLA
jgi:hypothetical protein